METIIITPYNLKAEGTAEYYVNKSYLSVRYSINTKEKNTVMRLWALSSKKPSNSPLKTDVPVFENGTAHGVKNITEVELGICGYNLSDIDTFVLTYEQDGDTKIAAAGFGGLKWNIAHVFDRNCKKEDINPVKKAEDLLYKLKGLCKGTGDYKAVVKGIIRACTLLKESNCIPLSDYSWYHFDKNVFPLSLGIYNHLTLTSEFNKAYQKSRICLWGVKDVCHTAIAVYSENENPFVNAMDCAIYENGFWITGVLLNEEGQYFERIET